jgi:hypothetical protein
VEKGKIYPYAETGNTPFNPLSQPCSVVLRGIAHKIEVEAKEEYICSGKEYRGSAHRARGLNF